MDQQTINYLFTAAMSLCGLICIMLGWWLNNMWASLQKLQEADSGLVDRVAAIEILVAGQYIRKDEFERLANALFTKLDKLGDKLDNKADKYAIQNHT